MYASAFGINDAGRVTGTASDAMGASVAVLWEPDSSGVLSPTVLPSEGFAFAAAGTMNNRGQVVGAGYSYDPDFGYVGQALLWDVDTTTPTISGASANPALLWPPAHKMIDVMVSYDATDDSGSVECTLGPVTSNETLAPSDWTIVDFHHALLMSERTRSGTGRIYTIPITCVDPLGNTATERVVVTVPDDQGQAR